VLLSDTGPVSSGDETMGAFGMDQRDTDTGSPSLGGEAWDSDETVDALGIDESDTGPASMGAVGKRAMVQRPREIRPLCGGRIAAFGPLPRCVACVRTLVIAEAETLVLAGSTPHGTLVGSGLGGNGRDCPCQPALEDALRPDTCRSAALCPVHGPCPKSTRSTTFTTKYSTVQNPAARLSIDKVTSKVMS
jgi:hypothetical protein